MLRCRVADTECRGIKVSSVRGCKFRDKYTECNYTKEKDTQLRQHQSGRDYSYLLGAPVHHVSLPPHWNPRSWEQSAPEVKAK